MSAFSPFAGAANVSTYRVTVGTSNVNVTLPARPGTIRILNATAANILFVEMGAPAVVPVANGATGSMPLAGGAGSIPLLLEKGSTTTIGLIASAAATDVYITLGLGDTVG